MASDNELSFVVKMQDQATATLKGMGTSFDQLSSTIQAQIEATKNLTSGLTAHAAASTKASAAAKIHGDAIEAGGKSSKKAAEEHESSARALGELGEQAVAAASSLVGLYSANEMLKGSSEAYNELTRSLRMMALAAGEPVEKIKELHEAVEGIALSSGNATAEQMDKLAIAGLRLGGTAEQVQEFSEKLSQIGAGGNLEGITDSVERILADTGEGIEGVTKLGDALGALGPKTRGGVEGLTQLTAMLAQSTAGMNIGSRELVAFAATFAKLGLSGRAVAQFDVALTNIQTQSTNAGLGLRDLGNRIGMTNAEMTQMASQHPEQVFIKMLEVVKQITGQGGAPAEFLKEFGIESVKARNTAIQLSKGVGDLKTQISTVGDTEGGAKAYADAWKGLEQEFTSLGVAWTQFKEQVGADTFGPVVHGVEILSAGIQGATSFLKAIPGPVRTVLELMLPLAMGIGTASKAFGIFKSIVLAPSLLGFAAASVKTSEGLKGTSGSAKEAGTDLHATGVVSKEAAGAFDHTALSVHGLSASLSDIGKASANATAVMSATSSSMRTFDVALNNAKSAYAKASAESERATQAVKTMYAEMMATLSVGSTEFTAAQTAQLRAALDVADGLKVEAIAASQVVAELSRASHAQALNNRAMLDGAHNALAEATGIDAVTRALRDEGSAGTRASEGLEAAARAEEHVATKSGRIATLAASAGNGLRTMANGAIGAALALGDVIAAGEELYSSYKQQEDLGKMGVTWGDEFAALNPFNSEEAFQARMAAKKKAGQYHPELRPKPKAADEEPKQEEEKTPPQTRADDSVAVEAMLGKYDGLVSKISEAAEKQNQFDKAISDLKSTGPIDRYTSAIERVQQVLDAAKRAADPLLSLNRATDDQVAKSRAVTKEQQNQLAIREEIRKLEEGGAINAGPSGDGVRKQITAEIQYGQDVDQLKGFDEQVKGLSKQLAATSAITAADKQRVAIDQEIADAYEKGTVKTLAQEISLRALLATEKERAQAVSVEASLDTQGHAIQSYQEQLTLLKSLSSTQEEYNRRAGLLAKQTEGARDPLGAIATANEHEIETLSQVGHYREADIAALQQKYDLQQKGIAVDDEMLGKLTTYQQKLQDLKEAQSSGFTGWASKVPDIQGQLQGLAGDFSGDLAGGIESALQRKRGAFAQAGQALGASMIKYSTEGLLAMAYKGLGLTSVKKEADAAKAASEPIREAGRAQSEQALKDSKAFQAQVQSMTVEAGSVTINGQPVAGAATTGGATVNGQPIPVQSSAPASPTPLSALPRVTDVTASPYGDLTAVQKPSGRGHVTVSDGNAPLPAGAIKPRPDGSIDWAAVDAAKASASAARASTPSEQSAKAAVTASAALRAAPSKETADTAVKAAVEHTNAVKAEAHPAAALKDTFGDLKQSQSLFATSPAKSAAVSSAAGADNEVDSARAYLRSTATGAAAARKLDIDKLNPDFAVKLSESIKDARAQGLTHAGMFSGARPPEATIGHGQSGNFDQAGLSLHPIGMATDMANIGAPGSTQAHQWADIATKHGLFNPYGADNPREWNHYQALPKENHNVNAPWAAYYHDHDQTPERRLAMWKSEGLPMHGEDARHIAATAAQTVDTAAGNDVPLRSRSLLGYAKGNISSAPDDATSGLMALGKKTQAQFEQAGTASAKHLQEEFTKANTAVGSDFKTKIIKPIDDSSTSDSSKTGAPAQSQALAGAGTPSAFPTPSSVAPVTPSNDNSGLGSQLTSGLIGDAAHIPGAQPYMQGLSTLKSLMGSLGGSGSSVASAATGAVGDVAGAAGGGISSLFGGLGSLFSLFHTGGVVGEGSAMSRRVSPEVFANAPKFHSGGSVDGLGDDEFPAILQRGERVLTANQDQRAGALMSRMADMAANNNTPAGTQRPDTRQAGSGGNKVTMIVNAKDASSFRYSQSQIMAQTHASISRAGSKHN